MQNRGPNKGLEALRDMVFEGDHAASREILADRPGRTFDSVGQGRHAMEPTSDAHAELKDQFARLIADRLAEHGSDFDRLVLIAPPEALGRLRSALPPAVAGKVTRELGKDLTHLPNSELPDHLADIMPV